MWFQGDPFHKAWFTLGGEKVWLQPRVSAWVRDGNDQERGEPTEKGSRAS